MQFGQAIGAACTSFAITNIDDAFVLITFFSEAATSKSLTPFRIVLGQYLGFTIIIAISLIGFGVSQVLPAEPIGFMGLLPILLGVWRGLEVLLPVPGNEDEESAIVAGMKSTAKVASVTIMNGGDNISTYIPLFSQAEGPEIAVYVVTFYVLLGVWCLVAFVVMRQRHVLALAKKWVVYFLPFLYMGLGVYIVVSSTCYDWAIHKIAIRLGDNMAAAKGIMGGVTAGVGLICIGTLVGLRWRRKMRADRSIEATKEEEGEEGVLSPVSSSSSSSGGSLASVDSSSIILGRRSTTPEVARAPGQAGPDVA